MTDYWLSKFFFDMREPALREEVRAAPESVFDRYHLKPEVRRAIAERDLSVLAPRVNAYLLRYYCGYIGMPDSEFLSKISVLGGEAHG